MKKSRYRYRTSLAGLISVLLVAVSADAASLTVTSTADAGGTCPGTDCSLRQAIATALSGDTINFSLPANSAITLTSGELALLKNLTISGPGANLLSVQRSAAGGTPEFRIFNIGNFTVTISGLTIAHGSVSSSWGGGIRSDAGGTLTVTGCAITNNSADSGGGILLIGGTVIVTRCTISGNSAIEYGGGISNNGTLTLTNTTVFGNTVSTVYRGPYDYSLRGAKQDFCPQNEAVVAPA